MNRQRQSVYMIGGVSPEAVWSKYIELDKFVTSLKNDTSLSRLDLIDENKVINYDKVKDIFINSCPSDSGTYMKWILDGYIDGGNGSLEDIRSSMLSSLEKFIRLVTAKKIIAPRADIVQYCGLRGCRRKDKQLIGLNDLLDEFSDDTIVSNTKQRKIDKHAGADLVYEDEQFRVYHLKTKEAAIFYGKGTRWCTASSVENSMFDHYNKDGPIYVLIAKHQKSEDDHVRKFQLHLSTGQFMDELDHPLKQQDYKRYYNSFIRFLTTRGSELEKPNLQGNIPLQTTKCFSLFRLLAIFNNNQQLLIQTLNSNGEVITYLTNMIEDDVDDMFLTMLSDKNLVTKIHDHDGNTPLHLAMTAFAVIWLINHKVDPNSRNKHGETPLFNYFITSPVLKQLFDAGADPRAINDRGQTPLHHVSNPYVADVMLHSGMDPNILDKMGLSALHNLVDISNPKVSTIKTLLSWKKTDPNIRDRQGQTPLHVCINSYAIELLLEYGADPNILDNYGKSPLDYERGYKDNDVITRLFFVTKDPFSHKRAINRLSRNGRCQLFGRIRNNTDADILLYNGLDPYIRDTNGNTSLYYATTASAVSWLVIYGLNPNSKNQQGRTPLFSPYLTVESVVELIKRGADLSITDGNGQTPLHNTLIHVDIAKILLKHNINPNITDISGNTPLHLQRHQFVSMTLLLDYGADPNIKNNKGITPLHWLQLDLESESKTECVILLLSRGADPNIQDNQGLTVLHECVVGLHQDSNTEVIHLLLKGGSDPNIQDNKDQTVLHKTTDPRIAIQLLNGGADPNIRDNNGQLPDVLSMMRT